MDGYAVRHSDSEQLLRISQRVAAGDHPEALAAGTAARIFTGAEIPAGADAVVMQEQAEAQGDSVRVPAVAAGANIRRRGQDVEQDAVVIQAGTRLTPWHLGLAASVGAHRLSVREPLSVAIVSTGSELQEPGEPPRPGAIYNSNRYLLHGLLQTLGLQVVDLGVVADDAQATADVLHKAQARAQVIITTGGVSEGEEDHVRDVVSANGTLDIWKLAIKPGKPFAFGHMADRPVFGLPGNPASVLVTFLVLVKPFLDTCMGRVGNAPEPLPLKAGWRTQRPAKRQEYLRVRVRDGVLRPHPNQSSGMLSSACWADGLAVIPAGQVISEGMLLDYYPFSLLLA